MQPVCTYHSCQHVAILWQSARVPAGFPAGPNKTMYQMAGPSRLRRRCHHCRAQPTVQPRPAPRRPRVGASYDYLATKRTNCQKQLLIHGRSRKQIRQTKECCRVAHICTKGKSERRKDREEMKAGAWQGKRNTGYHVERSIDVYAGIYKRYNARVHDQLLCPYIFFKKKTTT